MFGNTRISGEEKIGFLLLPYFSMMAFTSSVEPLRAANQLKDKMLYSWHTYSVDGNPVVASNGVEIKVDDSLKNSGNAKTIIVCAGLGAESFNDKSVFRTLRTLAHNDIALGGVCTGALALARAGLLEKYRCTIHWENVEAFVEEFPDLEVTATMFEVDRNRYTCSGGTAPLDMMINSIARDHGDDLAVNVAELLLHTTPRHPHDPQRMPLEHRTGITHPKLLAVIAHMEAYIESPVAVNELAKSAGLSSRQLERLFRDRLRTTPSRYYLDLRLQRARLLLHQTTMSVLQIAVASGFGSASHFTRSYHYHFNKTPSGERRNVTRIAR